MEEKKTHQYDCLLLPFRLHRHRLLGGTGSICHIHVLRSHPAHKDWSTTPGVSVKAVLIYVTF